MAYHVIRVEIDGSRTMVRDDVETLELARGLVDMGNQGATMLNRGYKYEMESPDDLAQWVPEPVSVAPVTPTMYAFSFNLYRDGEFLTNVVVHATDRVAAWCDLGHRTFAAGLDYDSARLTASRPVDVV